MEGPIEQGVIKRCVEADGGDFTRVQMIPSTVTDEVTALQTDQVDTIWIYWAWAGVKCELAGLDTNYFAFAAYRSGFRFLHPGPHRQRCAHRGGPRHGPGRSWTPRAMRYEDCIEDPDAAADALLAAAPELDEELVRASQEYLADQYQADAAQWGVIDQDRWDAFFAWVSEQASLPLSRRERA